MHRPEYESPGPFRRTRLVTLGCVLWLLVPLSAHGRIVALGPPVDVGIAEVHPVYQWPPAPRALQMADGGFVVVWVTTQPGPVGGVVDAFLSARRFDAHGAPIGPEFVLQGTSGRLPLRQAVALIGSRLVAVFGDDSEAMLGSFALDGTAISTEPLGPVFVDGMALEATMDGVLLVWTDYLGPPSILARRFDTELRPLGAAFAIADDEGLPSGFVYPSSLITRPDGTLVVGVWNEHTGIISARLLDADGTPVGKGIEIGAADLGEQINLCGGAPGEFAAVWSQKGWGSGGVSPPTEFRRFDERGEPSTPLRSPDLYVATGLACLADGTLVVGGTRDSVRASHMMLIRAVDALDRPVGQHAADFAAFPTLTTLSASTFVSTWRRGHRVYAQMFSVPDDIDCPGDCDGNGAVTIDELVLGVTLALGDQCDGSQRPRITECPAMDKDLDCTVTIDEIVEAVGGALRGCEDGR